MKRIKAIYVGSPLVEVDSSWIRVKDIVEHLKVVYSEAEAIS